MKNLIVACVFISVASAAVIPNDEAQAQIVSYENTNDGAGNYRFSFKTSNGITREEFGYLANVGQEDEHIVVIGSYSYTDVDGKLLTISYTGDEKGYHYNIQENVGPLTPGTGFTLNANVVATLLGK